MLLMAVPELTEAPWGSCQSTSISRALVIHYEVCRQIMKVLFSGDCRLDERLMEMNHIQLQSPRRSSPSTFVTGEYILFECKWWYQQISRPEKFRAECKDGVITYPTCECKCSVPRTRRGCMRQLC